MSGDNLLITEQIKTKKEFEESKIQQYSKVIFKHIASPTMLVESIAALPWISVLWFDKNNAFQKASVHFNLLKVV